MTKRISAMGQWMLFQGRSMDSVLVFEAYLEASRRKRKFTCLMPRYYLKPKETK